MSLPLPDAIAIFFAVSNGADDALLAHCLAHDAAVRDEGRTHEGPEAIRAWLRDARRRYAYRVAPLEVSRQGDGVSVMAEVAGDFPGSPVRLAHVFGLRGGRIASLEIG